MASPKRARVQLLHVLDRESISYCKCSALSHTHTHCPYNECEGRAVSHATEYRHWKNTVDAVTFSSNSQSSSDSESGGDGSGGDGSDNSAGDHDSHMHGCGSNDGNDSGADDSAHGGYSNYDGGGGSSDGDNGCGNRQ